MSLAEIRRLPDEDRRAHIIAAAERVFVSRGFHAATMTQVADEAGMSAGNLYRYFPSKEAIVEGLCAIGQAERSYAFVALARADDLKAAMRAALSEHVLDCSPDKPRMIVEIWAESCRNDKVAALTQQLDRDVMSGLCELVNIAKQRGMAPAALDARFAASLLFTLFAGLTRRKALEPHFDAASESAMAFGVLDALFDGRVAASAEV